MRATSMDVAMNISREWERRAAAAESRVDELEREIRELQIAATAQGNRNQRLQERFEDMGTAGLNCSSCSGPVSIWFVICRSCGLVERVY